MSAVAVLATQNEMILLSDGITFHANESGLPEGGTLTRDDCKIHSTNTSKIFAINSRVGVSWTGNMLPNLQERFRNGCKEQGLSEPKQIANYLSKLLKQEYKGKNIKNIVGTYDNVNITVNGFDKQGIPWGISITAKTEFEPVEHRLAQNGLRTACMIPFIEGKAPFDRLLEKHNKRTTDPEELATIAFREMIRDYEEQNILVGGQIFTEVLRP